MEELSRSSDKILYGQDQRNVSRPLLQPGNYSLEPLNMLDQRNYNLFNNPLNLKDENHGFYYRDVNVNDNSRVANMNFQGSEQVRFNTPEVVRYNFQGHPVDMPLPNMPPMSSEQLRQRNAVGGQMSQASLLSTENQLELPRTEGGHVSPSRGVTGSRTITSTEPTSFSHSPYRQQPMSLSMSQFGSSLHQQVGHTSPVDNFHGTNLISNLVQNFPQGNNPYGHFGASLSPTNSQQAYMTHGPTSPPSPYFGTSLAPGTSQQTPVMNRPTSPRPTNVTPNTYQQNLLTHRPTSPRPVIDRQLQNHTLENTPYRQFGMAVSPGPSGPGMMIHPNPPSNFERRKTSQPNLEDGGSRHQLQPPMSMSLPSRDAVYFHGDASSLERQRKGI